MKPSVETKATDAEASAAVETPETEGKTSNSAAAKGGDAEAVETQSNTEEVTEKSAREIELEEQLAELQKKTDAARKEARNAKDAKREIQKGAGEYQSLYEESEASLVAVTAERDTLVESVKVKDAELKTLRKELDTYRASLIERFESDADKELAKDTPIAKIPALYERLYGKGVMTPPPSQGRNRTATRTAEDVPLTREQELAKHYGVTLPT